MWIIRTFKSKENMQKFIDKNRGKIQWHEVFINNGWGIEYKRLVRIY
jgi:hypothetical protein